MALDQIIVDGDNVEFSFVGVTIQVPPVKIESSGNIKISNRRVCLEGDEKKIMKQCPYFTTSHPTPGIGLLTIKQLSENQLSGHSKIGGKRILMKGSTFQWEFKATQPAMDPLGSPDPVKEFSGTGKLIPSNNTTKASK
ncbi:MAG: hypothetical protein MI922_22900 [Bacteroidales bacterium]|nr:hypothetical protein [Bacteroidales bacterium]